MDYKQKVAQHGNTQIKYLQIVLQYGTDVTDLAVIYLQCNIHAEPTGYFEPCFKNSFGKFLFCNTCLERFECWSCKCTLYQTWPLDGTL